jgi:hypothetical protein
MAEEKVLLSVKTVIALGCFVDNEIQYKRNINCIIMIKIKSGARGGSIG